MISLKIISFFLFSVILILLSFAIISGFDEADILYQYIFIALVLVFILQIFEYKFQK